MEAWACGEAAVPEDGSLPAPLCHVVAARTVSDSCAFSLHPVWCCQTNLTDPAVVSYDGFVV